MYTHDKLHISLYDLHLNKSEIVKLKTRRQEKPGSVDDTPSFNVSSYSTEHAYKSDWAKFVGVII